MPLSFTYSVEQEFCDYLINNITGSVNYPILRGHTNNYSGSFNYPVIAVILDEYVEEIMYTGKMLALCSVKIATQAQNSSSYDTHGAAVDGAYNALGLVQNVRSWINNPSSSLEVQTIWSEGVVNMFDGGVFLTETKWRISAQQQHPQVNNFSDGVG